MAALFAKHATAGIAELSVSVFHGVAGANTGPARGDDGPAQREAGGRSCVVRVSRHADAIFCRMRRAAGAVLPEQLALSQCDGMGRV